MILKKNRFFRIKNDCIIVFEIRVNHNSYPSFWSDADQDKGTTTPLPVDTTSGSDNDIAGFFKEVTMISTLIVILPGPE